MTPTNQSIRFTALPSDEVRRLRAGELDANAMAPERQVSDGGGNPCRHCLQDIAEGDEMLVLAYRPFPERQPYAELGPIFLHAEACTRHAANAEVPQHFLKRAAMLVRGYLPDNRIKDGSGKMVTTEALDDVCREMLDDPEIAYVHLRSATNNCYQARVERA